MNIIDALTMELVFEAQNTRKALERAPEEHLGWKPHPKSMTLGRLASHIAEIPGWVAPTLNSDELVLDGSFKALDSTSKTEILKAFDEGLEQAKSAMAGYPNDKLMQDWALKQGDKVMFKMPRIQVFRGFILNHTVHHRGQLTVYLRLKDLPVPSIYGPSADEQG